MANTRLSAFFSLLLVFVSGAVLGVVGNRVYTTRFAPVPPVAQKKSVDPEVRRRQLIEEMAREVKLDPDQVQKLQRIYDDTRARFMDFHKGMNEKSHEIWDDQIKQIREILRPDQIPLYEQLRARHEAEREENDRKKGRKGTAGIKKDQ